MSKNACITVFLKGDIGKTLVILFEGFLYVLVSGNRCVHASIENRVETPQKTSKKIKKNV